MVLPFRMTSFGRKSGVDSSKDKTFERAEIILSIPAYALCECTLVTMGTLRECRRVMEHNTVARVKRELVSLKISL